MGKGDTPALGFYRLAERGAFDYIVAACAEAGVEPETVELEDCFLPAWGAWLDAETRAAVARFRFYSQERAGVLRN